MLGRLRFAKGLEELSNTKIQAPRDTRISNSKNRGWIIHANPVEDFGELDSDFLGLGVWIWLFQAFTTVNGPSKIVG